MQEHAHGFRCLVGVDTEIKVPIRINRSHFSDIYRKHTYKSIN